MEEGLPLYYSFVLGVTVAAAVAFAVAWVGARRRSAQLEAELEELRAFALNRFEQLDNPNQSSH
ncbi:MAG: hypothetical protein JNJ80_06150 [Gemmatimonadetes bacterium]|nr:hypothetical protein [Gemmatimonadota bacterium]MCC7133868.1 hypothetical protein [Gemmatimonadales bacterium]